MAADQAGRSVHRAVGVFRVARPARRLLRNHQYGVATGMYPHPVLGACMGRLQKAFVTVTAFDAMSALGGRLILLASHEGCGLA